jgi:hypothetical protein
MENEQEQPKEEAVVEQEQPVVEEAVVEEPQESVEELKQRLANAKAENIRKTQELQKLREQTDSRNAPAKQKFDPTDLSTWNDIELKAVLKDPQYAAIQTQAEELLDKRRFQRYHAEQEESKLRVNAELERQKRFPETLDPSHPMAIRMSELMHLHRLDRTPAGYLVAAELAASQFKQQKASAAGRKLEQSRQTDVKVNFQGEASRPAPKVSDKSKVEELKKRAMQGDEEARREWMAFRISKGL